MRNQLIAEKGSVQSISVIPQEIKDLYKTVWEIKQKAIIDQAADRGAFICQSQSLNIHIAEPTKAKLTSMHFYAWKKGLKTGMYYLRTRPRAEAIQFTVDQTALAKSKKVGADADAAALIASVASAGPKVVLLEDASAGKAIQGLDFAAEPVCESCSA